MVSMTMRWMAEITYRNGGAPEMDWNEIEQIVVTLNLSSLRCRQARSDQSGPTPDAPRSGFNASKTTVIAKVECNLRAMQAIASPQTGRGRKMPERLRHGVGALWTRRVASRS
jgi:hypothetical protein